MRRTALPQQDADDFFFDPIPARHVLVCGRVFFRNITACMMPVVLSAGRLAHLLPYRLFANPERLGNL